MANRKFFIFCYLIIIFSDSQINSSLYVERYKKPLLASIAVIFCALISYFKIFKKDKFLISPSYFSNNETLQENIQLFFKAPDGLEIQLLLQPIKTKIKAIITSVGRDVRDNEKEKIEERNKELKQAISCIAVYEHNRNDEDHARVINFIGTMILFKFSNKQYIDFLFSLVENDYFSNKYVFNWTIRRFPELFFQKGPDGNSILHTMLSQHISYTRIKESFLYLFEHLQKIRRTDLLETKNNEGETILFSVLKNNEIDQRDRDLLFNRIIKSGAEVNIKNKNGELIADIIVSTRFTKEAQVDWLWSLFKFPFWKDVPKYKPGDPKTKSFFQNQQKDITVNIDTLKTILPQLNILYEYYKTEVVNYKGLPRLAIFSFATDEMIPAVQKKSIQSFWILHQTRAIIHDKIPEFVFEKKLVTNGVPFLSKQDSGNKIEFSDEDLI